MRFSKSDFTLGALYKLAAKRRMSRSCIEALMVERVGMTAKKAKQLTALWLTTEAFRSAA